MEPESEPVIADEDLDFISKWTKESNFETLKAHILALWHICKKTYHVYVCIERLAFLKPRLTKHFAYESLISKLKTPDSQQTPKYVIDVGCCFGQDVRQLILEGIEKKSIFASDIHDGYWNAGKEFFMDNLLHSSTRLDGITTLFDDFAQPYPLPTECTNRVVDSLTSHFDTVISQMVFHVLSKEQTENIIKRMFAMLKKGGIFLGTCLASKEEATTWAATPKGDGIRFLHSLKSLTETLSENGFIQIDVREIQLTAGAGGQRYGSSVPKMPEGKPEVKKCRLEFVAYKK